LTNRGRRSKRKSSFLSEYRLDERYLKRAEKARGIPGLIAGTSPKGFPVLVKRWPRDPTAQDADLRDIWQNEIRQLHRLAGYPGASDYIVRLDSAGYDTEGFYLVLDTGSRRPLESLVSQSPPSAWILQPGAARHRALIWANLSRVAKGLELLHDQGLLHRNLDSFAVMGSGAGEPDFQLTGFEWSMRIIAAQGTRLHKSAPDASTFESFDKDWIQYGQLAAHLLQIDERRLADLLIPPFEVATHVTVDEIYLLRDILRPRAELQLDGATITERIQGIVDLLSQHAAGNEGYLYLALRVDSSSALSRQIREALNNEVELSDANALLGFVRDDFTDGATLEAVWNDREHSSFRLVLRGRHLAYRLEDFQRHGTRSNWEFAFCTSCDRVSDYGRRSLGRIELDSRIVSTFTLPESLDLFPRMRGRVASWESLRRDLGSKGGGGSLTDRFLNALTLVQVIELLFAVAEIYPVTIVSSARTSETVDDHFRLRLVGRLDVDRDGLSRSLCIRSPQERLHSALLEDVVREESKWTLTDLKHLGDHAPTDTDWAFSEVEETAGRRIYAFSGTASAAFSDDAFLIPAGSIGRDAVLARRLRALRAIHDHSELLESLADPRRRVTDSHESVTADEFVERLDEPKRRALRELTAILPMYLVQGPPGVGKTFLVTELVRRQFAEDATRRMLLSAQSHYAVDHLLQEVRKLQQADAAFSPLAVRCRRRDSDEEAGPLDVEVQAQALLDGVAASEMLEAASAGIKAAVIAAAKPGDGAGATPAARVAKRAFEALVLRAANLVFATTNSAELDRLIEERSQFDWTVVEEAGKATGGELVSPLLLSHRRLLIGDHKQLPPFDSDKIIALLRNPEAVKDSLGWVNSMIGRRLRDTTIDELLDDVAEFDSADLDDVKHFTDLCGDAERALFLFQTLFETEIRRQERATGADPPLAIRLTVQHRMHPTIAGIISTAFYPDLKTDPTAASRYAGPSPVRSVEPARLPDLPVVWIDMPSLQHTPGMTKGDRYPRYHNPPEVAAVLTVLSLLAASQDAIPSLAVLSPYSQQVRRLGSAIDSERLGRLSQLASFRAESREGRLCHTVDSFQGSEADAVVISLVRNNQRGGLRALGFLSDPRRMNVLLSRAKWRLIIVGSMQFLREIAHQHLNIEDSARLGFFRKVLSYIEAQSASGSMAIVPWEKLKDGGDKK
jgi:AAA domain